MFEVKTALKAAFAEIDITPIADSVAVLSSSWISQRIKYELPAIVCDMDGVTPVLATEEGIVLGSQYSFPLTAVVAIDQGDEQAEANLEALVDAIEAKLIEKIGRNNYTIENFFPMNIPWNGGEALAGSFSLKVIQ